MLSWFRSFYVVNKQVSVASRCFTSVYLVESCSGRLHCFQLFFVSCVFSLLSVDVSKGSSFRIFGKNVKFFIRFQTLLRCGLVV